MALANFVWPLFIASVAGHDVNLQRNEGHMMGLTQGKSEDCKSCDKKVSELSRRLHDAERRMQGMEAIIAWALTPSMSNAVHPHISMLEQQAVTSALEKIRLGVTELDLDNAGISDAGMTVIAQALRHSRLRTLSLSRNALGDAGALRLAEALPHCGEHLTHLKLHNNMIGDQ